MKNKTILGTVCGLILCGTISLTSGCKKDNTTATNPGTCTFTPLADGHFTDDAISDTFTSGLAFTSGANWQLSARGGTSPSTGIGIQFPEKPTADKTYTVVAYGAGQVTPGSDQVFVYTSSIPGGNDNGVAGGCLKATIRNGKVVGSFKDLTLASGKKLSATIVEQ